MKVRTQLSERTSELDEMKGSQREYCDVLQKRLDEITHELRRERERRVEAEFRCTVNKKIDEHWFIQLAIGIARENNFT